MKLKGSMCITRPQYGDGSRLINIRVKDDSSSIQFLVIEIPYEEFVMALTSSDGEMEYDLRGADKVGMRLEVKSELVVVPKAGFGRDERLEAAQEAIKPYEIDGWRGRSEDATNHHNWSRGKNGEDLYQVVFTRHVDEP